jgi:hypothetical protein
MGRTVMRYDQWRAAGDPPAAPDPVRHFYQLRLLLAGGRTLATNGTLTVQRGIVLDHSQLRAAAVGWSAADYTARHGHAPDVTEVLSFTVDGPAEMPAPGGKAA